MGCDATNIGHTIRNGKYSTLKENATQIAGIPAIGVARSSTGYDVDYGLTIIVWPSSHGKVLLLK